MEHILAPSALFPIAIIVISLGSVIAATIRKTRESELSHHQELRVREMEHERKMKELEIELEKSRAQNSAIRVA